MRRWGVCLDKERQLLDGFPEHREMPGTDLNEGVSTPRHVDAAFCDDEKGSLAVPLQDIDGLQSFRKLLVLWLPGRERFLE